MPRKRRIIYYCAMSADGFIGRPDGAVDWLERKTPKGHYGWAAFYRSVDTVIFGRKTYDFAVAHGMPEGSPGKKNYVFSRTLTQAASPKVTVVNGDVRTFAGRLRAEKGKDIWLMGGADIAKAFVDAGELDEFFVHVIPTMLGEGIPLVASRKGDVKLRLLECKRFSDGAVRLRYAVARPK